MTTQQSSAGPRGFSVNPAPSVRTQQHQATQATTQGQGAQLSAIGSALGSFFGTTAKTIESIGDIQHREELVEIERQNETRKAQGLVDAASGAPRNETLNGFQAYKGAYDVAVADETAARISTDLGAAIRDLPNTPDQDLDAFATDFVRKQVAGGTGDPTIDGRVAWGVKRQADQLLAQKRELIAQTAESNIAETISKSLTRKMMEQGGVTTGQVDGFYAEALGLMKGDVAKADHFFAGVLKTAIYNPGHAASTLAAMRESGFAQRNPDVYREITEAAWHRTNQIKSVAAGNEVEQVNTAYAAAQANYRNAGTLMPVQEYLGFIRRAADVDNRHGVGRGQFPWLTAGLDDRASGHAGARAALQTQADANAIVQAFLGQNGGSLRRVLSNGTAKEPEFNSTIQKSFIPAVNTIMQLPGFAERYPDLAAAQQAGGGYDFLASRQSAGQFGRLLGSRPDAFGFAVDDNTAAQFSDALMSGDPQRMINAVTGAAALRDTPGGEQFLRSLLRDDKARARFDVIVTRARDAGGLENAVSLVVADAGTERREHKAATPGRIDWADALRDPEMKGFAAQDEIDRRAAKALTKASGHDGVIFNPRVNLHPALQEKLYRLTARHAYEQQANLPAGGKPDLSQAADWAAKSVAAEAVPISAQGGVLRYIPDPYAGKGRQLKDPIATYGGRKVYAGAKIVNAFGQEEDPHETFMRKDLPAIVKTFSGLLGLDPADDTFADEFIDGLNPDRAKVAEGRQIRQSGAAASHVYLAPPDTKPGLMPIMKTGQVPLAVFGGQTVRINGKDQVIPTSPAEADSFFAGILPPGVHVIRGAPTREGANTYRFAYGYRLVGDERAAAEELHRLGEARKAEIKVWQANADPITGAVQHQKHPVAFARP